MDENGSMYILDREEKGQNNSGNKAVLASPNIIEFRKPQDTREPREPRFTRYDTPDTHGFHDARRVIWGAPDHPEKEYDIQGPSVPGRGAQDTEPHKPGNRGNRNILSPSTPSAISPTGIIEPPKPFRDACADILESGTGYISRPVCRDSSRAESGTESGTISGTESGTECGTESGTESDSGTSGIRSGSDQPNVVGFFKSTRPELRGPGTFQYKQLSCCNGEFF